MTIRYDCTPHGVMVQVHVDKHSDADWRAMLDYMVARKDTIRAVMAISQRDEAAPSSKQRAELAETLKHMRAQMPFALLTDSRIARGVLTAINWLTKRQDQSRVFAPDRLDDALSFFALNAEESAAVRSLVRKLGATG